MRGRYNKIKSQVRNRLIRLEVILDDIEKLEVSIESKENNVKDLSYIKDVLNQIVNEYQVDLIEDINSLVSYGLTEVFEIPIMFKVIYDISRGKPSVKFQFIKDGKEESLESQGGGTWNVISFLLRILIIILKGFPRIVILDEGFTWLFSERESNTYIHNLGDLLRKLSEKLDFQFILITHHPELSEYADVDVEVMAGGKFQIRENKFSKLNQGIINVKAEKKKM